jgi:hypothetical protein
MSGLRSSLLVQETLLSVHSASIGMDLEGAGPGVISRCCAAVKPPQEGEHFAQATELTASKEQDI